MSCILVFMGLPGSGKTFLAGKLCSYLQSKQFEVNIFSFDDLCPMDKQAEIANRSSNDSFRNYRSLMKAEVQRILSLPNPQNVGRIVIVDDNNYYKSMRYEYYQVAAKFVIGFLQIFVQCEGSLAVTLNNLRPIEKRVTADVIMLMESKLEVPSETWENTLTVRQGGLDDSNLMQVIQKCIQEAYSNPVRMYEKLAEKQAEATKSKLSNECSSLHKVDKILRKLINRKIQERDQEVEPRVLAKHLNVKRQSFMERIKSGHIALPKGFVDVESQLENSIERLFDEWSNSCSVSKASP